MLALDEESIHLWYVEQADFDAEELQANCLDWLTNDELSRYKRFYFDRHRKQMLLGRMLMRLTLSQYSDIAPGDWRFVENNHGKPAIDPGQRKQALFFNLSHSGDRLALAVCRHEYIGVDIESSNKTRRVLQIADRYFSPAEVEALQALPEAKQLSRFYDLWTLKEAYIKARGLGLAIPLQQFSFGFEDSDSLSVSFDDKLGDEVRAWQMWHIDPGKPCKLAVAVKPEAVKIKQLESRRYSGMGEFAGVATRILRSTVF